MSGIYNRFFVPLRQDRHEYTLPNRKALGNCIVEYDGTAGKLSVTVQDLKPQIIYKLYLVSTGSLTKVCAGTVAVDERGKGSLKWAFTPGGVGESNIPIDGFDVFAVLVPCDNEVISPLAGYINEPVMWKHIINPPANMEIKQEPPVNEPEDMGNEDSTPEAPEAEAEAAHTEPIEPESESEPAVEALEDAAEEEAGKPFQEPQPEAQAIPEAAAKEAADEPVCEKAEAAHDKAVPGAAAEAAANMEVHEAFRQMARNFKKELDALNNTYNNYDFVADNEAEKPLSAALAQEKKAEVNETSVLFLNNRKMKPFVRQNKDVEWIRVSITELAQLPNQFSSLARDPVAVKAERAYKHLILGRFFEAGREHYILGIPALYEPSLKRELTQKGFVQFKCCEDEPAEPGDPGYFLIPV